MPDPQNLFVALRGAFPDDLDAVAVETVGMPALYYTWRDLERGTAMLANLVDSLGLPADSRIAVQTEKSVEAMMLYLAVLRAGLVYLPLNTAYQHDEIAYFIGNANANVTHSFVRRIRSSSCSPGRKPQSSPERIASMSAMVIFCFRSSTSAAGRSLGKKESKL